MSIIINAREAATVRRARKLKDLRIDAISRSAAEPCLEDHERGFELATAGYALRSAPAVARSRPTIVREGEHLDVIIFTCSPSCIHKSDNKIIIIIDAINTGTI